MKQFILDPGVVDLFPDVQINVMTLQGIDNHIQADKLDYFQTLLDEGTKAAQQFITVEPFRENPVVDQWRQAFRQFKTKKGARATTEALLKRVSQGKTFSPIMPLVDIYNSVSLKYGASCGGEDVDAIVGDMHQGIAKGGESFLPYGETEDMPALSGEVCYLDNKGAVCRCFNWRESQRTELTEATTNPILVIESINREQAKRADSAIIELQKLCDDFFKVEGTLQKVTADNRAVVISE
ncbi:B3/B4 domain-containing protein [Lentilactobacillus kisonensis]|uniref:B3 4 domain protein n=1 Tax=Lentilactobacillus kisonensis DSM 19906 = JCM 15041 TaxID=1423766 RepID=A0A0R1NHR6_9LACO|nr:phenylalanine--tRNA ligase beta subunit-related protein [Lentilactobacillus kisonensis]KRL19968.1 b3 4 domain protein [Lentilactobacillus kisonensis DSM 19906 = JCM 15041]